MNQMPNEDPGMSMTLYTMARNILFSLLISQDLMTKEKLEKEFEYERGIPLYDDVSWVYEQAEVFKKKYDEKRKIVEETRVRIREARKNSKS